MREMAAEMNVCYDKIKSARRCAATKSNPMLGHRGCRLGNTYPEITEMQARAIIEAALNIEEKRYRRYTSRSWFRW